MYALKKSATCFQKESIFNTFPLISQSTKEFKFWTAFNNFTDLRLLFKSLRGHGRTDGGDFMKQAGKLNVNRPIPAGFLLTKLKRKDDPNY